MYIDLTQLNPDNTIIGCGGCGKLICCTPDEILEFTNPVSSFVVAVVPCPFCGEHNILPPREEEILGEIV